MQVIFETPRLLLRTFTPADAPLLYDLSIDPEVTRYTHDTVRDISHAREILEENILPQYALYNYGRWAVLLKPGFEFIGYCGLKYRPEIGEVDLGYRYKKRYWGKGFASEAAFATIKFGFEKLSLTIITARAEPGNIASWNVLEKCGMTFTGMQEVKGFPVKAYETRNPLTI